MTDVNKLREQTVQDFLNNNRPARFYKVKRRWSLKLGRYNLEVRILKDE